MQVQTCTKCAGGAIARTRIVQPARITQVRIYQRIVGYDTLIFGVTTLLITGLSLGLGLMVAFVDDRTFDIDWWAALNCTQLFFAILWVVSVSAHWSAMDPWLRGAGWLASIMACASASAGLIGAIFWGIWKLDSQQLVTGTTCTQLLNIVPFVMIVLRACYHYHSYNTVVKQWQSEGPPYLGNLLPWW